LGLALGAGAAADAWGWRGGGRRDGVRIRSNVRHTRSDKRYQVQRPQKQVERPPVFTYQVLRPSSRYVCPGRTKNPFSLNLICASATWFAGRGTWFAEHDLVCRTLNLICARATWSVGRWTWFAEHDLVCRTLNLVCCTLDLVCYQRPGLRGDSRHGLRCTTWFAGRGTCFAAYDLVCARATRSQGDCKGHAKSTRSVPSPCRDALPRIDNSALIFARNAKPHKDVFHPVKIDDIAWREPHDTCCCGQP